MTDFDVGDDSDRKKLMPSETEEEEKLTWDERYEMTMRQVGRLIRESEQERFKEFFYSRECVGWSIDPQLILFAFRARQELERGLDKFIVISGTEGTGKSFLLMQLSSWIVGSDFTLNDIVYDAASFVEKMRIKANQPIEDYKIQILGLDEAINLLSRETASITNRAFVKTFFVQRILKFCIIICCPNFHMLDSIVRMHRVDNLIYVKSRGRYRLYARKAIAIINHFGFKFKNQMVRMPQKYFLDGYFCKSLPKTIIEKEYLQLKMDGIRRTLTELSSDLCSPDSPERLVKISQACRQMGITRKSLLNLCATGAVPNKKIGGLYYIQQKDVSDFLNTKDKTEVSKNGTI